MNHYKDFTKMYYIIILVMSILITSACTSINDPVVFPTPYYTIPPSEYDNSILPTITVTNKDENNPNRIMPFALSCDEIPPAQQEGPSWNELTIGVTSYEEMQIHMSPLEAITRKDTVAILYWNPTPDTEWTLTEACFRENTLSALNIFHPRSFPSTLENWTVMNGEPDLITWSDQYDARSVIWTDKGILVVIEQFPLGKTRNVILFDPFNREELSSSWLVDALPNELIGSDPDTIPLPTKTP